ncbi:hypothetical protein [Maribacter luteus]|uniref:hypothetical protein n=1 Tax=Maribacter luteus TaxID=2594478 RepID=UPI0024907761|nr:hypothetical protein [Maribacter luteus]
MKTIQELDGIFTKGSKTFKQIKSSYSAYLYEVTDTETDHIYYEVFENKEVKKRVLPSGTLMSDRVAYPSNSDFGIWAWCISRGSDDKKALKHALIRFNFLSEQGKVA